MRGGRGPASTMRSGCPRKARIIATSEDMESAVTAENPVMTDVRRAATAVPRTRAGRALSDGD